MWGTIGLWLDWILRITGAISICWQIIKKFFPKNEYIENIVIKQIQSIEDTEDIGLHFFEVFNVNSCSEGQYFVIYPVNADIKKLRIVEVEYNGRKLVNKKVLKTYKDIKNNRGLVINTIVPDTIPLIKIEWNMGKGLKGEYPISFNGFNGNTSIVSYRYENNILRVINRIFK